MLTARPPGSRPGYSLGLAIRQPPGISRARRGGASLIVLGKMGSPEPIHLALELDPGSEPVSGIVTLHHGRQHRFVGWLELIQIVDAARNRDDRSDQLTDRRPPESGLR